MTQQPHDLVNHFNHDHTIGTPVRYWTGTREGAGKTSHIRTRAELMGGHTPVVWVEGEASAIALTHIEPITLNPLDRARRLAADYQANPTPARAHNAAQVLGAVLAVLDEYGDRPSWKTLWAEFQATSKRMTELTDENAALRGRVDELETTVSILEDSEPFSYDDCRDDCDGCHESLPTCDCHITGTEARDVIRNLRDRVERAEEAANHWTAVNLPVPICSAPGPTPGLKCFLAAGHEGDHSTNAHPNPRTWPRLATGGIVDPNRTARIGGNS